MPKLVLMLIIGWTPQGGTLREAWRIERVVPVEHCLIMSRFSGGSRYGAVTVRCGEWP